MEWHAETMRWWRKYNYRFRRLFLVSTVTNAHIRHISPESLYDSLEAALLSDLGRAVHVFDSKHLAQPIQKEFGEGGD